METWPALPLHEWRETRDTLHREMQVVGKLQLALSPVVNHWWNVPLQVSARGFRTATLPYQDRWLDLELDLVSDVLRLRTNDGGERTVPLGPRTVASFYDETLSTLRSAGIEAKIWPVPCECEDTLRLDRDEIHHAYDKEYVLRFWRTVALTSAVLNRFRARFIGKSSPVHFFWGSFDLAVTRFSGRRAPALEGVGAIEREAYSHEVSSVGWWPGDSRLEKASFYSYASPEPPGFREAAMATPGTYYHPSLKGFYLDHDEVRRAAAPEARLLDFCETSYAAAANLGGWNRPELERS